MGIYCDIGVSTFILGANKILREVNKKRKGNYFRINKKVSSHPEFFG